MVLLFCVKVAYFLSFSNRCRTQNGTEAMEVPVQLRKHRRTVSHTNRSSYMEAVSRSNIITLCLENMTCAVYTHMYVV